MPLGELVASYWNDGTIPHTPNTWHGHKVIDPKITLRLGNSEIWSPFTMDLQYLSDPISWLGVFTFRQLTGILNYSEKKLRAHVAISRKDVPDTRSEEWQPLSDYRKFLKSQPNTLVVTCEGLDPQKVNLDDEWNGHVSLEHKSEDV
jgi:hypothetical protein